MLRKDKEKDTCARDDKAKYSPKKLLSPRKSGDDQKRRDGREVNPGRGRLSRRDFRRSIKPSRVWGLQRTEELSRPSSSFSTLTYKSPHSPASCRPVQNSAISRQTPEPPLPSSPKAPGPGSCSRTKRLVILTGKYN